MISSSEIMKNSTLKREVSNYMTTSLDNKSHSVNNTRKTIQKMLEVAIQTRNTNREKDLLRWLQFCIDTCLSQQNVPTNNADDDELDNDEPVSKKYNKKNNKNDTVAQNSDKLIIPEPKKKTNNTKKTSTAASKKKNNKKKNQDEDYDESAGYHVIGASDDDYVPSELDYDNDDSEDGDVSDEEDDKNDDDDNDDQLVPLAENDKNNQKVTTAKKKKPAKRKPKVQYTPLVDDGAGTKAVTTYFMKNHVDSNITKDGYFAKSYFFPSEESFNAFSSVLRSAQKTIDICVFSMTDDDVANILIAAKKRNVKIRIITDDQQASNKAADAKRLQDDHGIPYKTDHSSSYMHHKFASKFYFFMMYY
ncbi:hypothetical protein BJ944DRAFT_117608 [Cunninghamella echinulata]|nr:hypothetical protein BJ944DRAFT_117608 [Cunninghamella echinulata]